MSDPDRDDLRRPGRPRGPERSAVAARFAAAEHDRIIEAAAARGMTVADFVRRAVLQALPPGPRRP